MRSDFCALVLNWAIFLEATLLSLLIRPINKSPSQYLNIGLTLETKYKADLKQGIHLGQVIYRILKIADFGHNQG